MPTQLSPAEQDGIKQVVVVSAQQRWSVNLRKSDSFSDGKVQLVPNVNVAILL